MSEWAWKCREDDEEEERMQKQFAKDLEKSRQTGWFLVKSKVIQSKEQNKKKYFCCHEVKIKTPFIQVMSIEAGSLGGADALTYLAEALCETGPEIGKFARGADSVWRLSLAMECAERNHPPLVICNAAEFPKFYPQFIKAPSAPYNGKIYVLTLKAEDGKIGRVFYNAYERLTGKDPKPFCSPTFHGPFEGLMSSYESNELVVAFHAVDIEKKSSKAPKKTKATTVKKPKNTTK